MRSYYPNRVLCSVLDEMRECYKTRNFSHLNGLIEEAQSMANRMEAGLSDKKDLLNLNIERSKLKKQVLHLREEIKKLVGKPNEESENE